MDLDHSIHVNDAHILEIAPGAFAGSAYPPAWGGDESVSDYFAQRWAGLFSDPAPLTDSKQATPPLYPDQPHSNLLCSTPGLATPA